MSTPITPPVKTWRVRSSDDSVASIRVSEDWASISAANAKNFVTADRGGVSIGGKISYQGLPNQVTFGGLLTFPFFPLLFLPIGPTMVPSLDIPMFAVTFAKITSPLLSLLL